MTPKSKSLVPYGLWPSPITPELLSTSSISLHEVLVHKQSGSIYWIESRPREGGRYTIMEHTETGPREVLPTQFSAHATVQELGGGTFTATPGGNIIFSDDVTKNVYALDPTTRKANLVLEAEQGLRYGDFAVHPLHSEWIVAVKEDHREATPYTQAYGVHNSLVAISCVSQSHNTVAVGDDFYGYPGFSDDGTRICWIQWSHPDMPWTGTTLYVGDWKDGTVQNIIQIAGARKTESICQPRWAPDGSLYFVSDRTGYWQLYTYSPITKSDKPIPIKGLEHSDFAIADWRVGSSTYAFLDQQTIVASCVAFATSTIVLVDLATGLYRDLKLPYLDLAMHSTGVFRVSNDSFIVLGSTQTSSKKLVLVSQVHSQDPEQKVLQSIMQTSISADNFSVARQIEVQRTSREGRVYAFYFAPQNAECEGPADTPPPGLIQLHGGPNGCTSPALDMSIQFWTSRGFAVCAVNYAGSTGFGRQYREELTGNWGLYDVLDTSDVAKYLVDHNLFNGKQVGIYGGSAGGYGTLSAIHMFPNLFTAAVSSYGICDIKALQADSYKFESHDVERLILSSCAADDDTGRAKLYKERSPLYYVSNISAPLLILQGLDDKAVTPEQAHMMAAEMQDHGRVVKLVEFEGEGHGWLKEATILRAYKEQEDWWKTHLLNRP